MPVIDTPCEVVKSIALWSVVYVWLPEKYASSDVAMLRRSDFSEARYAFSFVLANFGIAIAAKMPMITTTIRSSISVKPLRMPDMLFSRDCFIRCLPTTGGCRLYLGRRQGTAETARTQRANILWPWMLRGWSPGA